MSAADSFFDTNVLLYLLSKDVGEGGPGRGPARDRRGC